MNVQRGKLVSGGRLQVPADMRRALGLTDGDEVLLRVVDGVLHVLPAREVVANIQNRLRQHLDTDASLSHELIADRRIAADHE